MYYAPETLLNHVFEDLRKTKAPTGATKEFLINYVFIQEHLLRLICGCNLFFNLWLLCFYFGIIYCEPANTRLTCPLWFGLMMRDCQRVALWGSKWANQSVRLCLCNHVGRLVVCMCGAQERWSTTEVKVMRARADGPGAMKGECWVLTDRS
jgi:hypothetical protein